MKTSRPSTSSGRRPDSALGTRRTSDYSSSTAMAVKDNFEEDIENILSSRIDENFLITASGVKDISRIEYISLQIDTNIQSLLDLHDLLPSLKHLVLDNSVIASIRDLGVGLRGITSLSLSGCGLRDIDGIGVLQGLQELSLNDNNISDVTPLMMHENLQNLNLSGNKIADLSFASSLSSCPRLRSLFLSRNPIERVPQYRAVVANLLPSLEMLDGAPVDALAAQAVTASALSNAAACLAALEDELDDEARLESEIFSSSLETNTQQYTQHSHTHNSLSQGGEGLPDTGSELTHGSSVVLAGNVAAAMRRRRTTRTHNNTQNTHTNTHRESEEAKEFESALDVLDAVLLAPPRSPTQHEDRERVFYREGDITDSVLGSPVRVLTERDRERASGVELDMDVVFSPRRAARESENSMALSSARRPKSAFGGVSAMSVPSTPKRSGEESSGRPPAVSPRQKNSSRPQSAINQLGGIALPFNIAVRETRGDSDDEDDQRASLRKIAALHNKTDDDGNYARKGSLVHMDIVVRRTAGKPDLGGLEDIEDEDEDEHTRTPTHMRSQRQGIEDDSDEDIAVTHRERLRMMSVSASNNTATLQRQRQHVLQRLKGTHTDSVQEEDASLPPKGRRKSSNPALSSGGGTPREGIAAVVSNMGTASKAGKSLGFNLAGSLAAIDQWVKDMNSDDDEHDGSDSENEQIVHGKSTLTQSGVRSRPHSAFSEESVTPRGGGEVKILSRDAIFQLCTNTSAKNSKLGDSVPASRRQSCDSILSAESHSDKVPRTLPTQQPLPAHSLPAQKVALLSKVTVAKTTAVPAATQRPVNNTEMSFIAEDASQKPRVSKERASSTASKPSLAIHMSDSELVDLLRKPPKSVTVLRTKASFQEFFRGIEAHRFRKLLQNAFDDISDKADRESKIKRRMELMEDVFA